MESIIVAAFLMILYGIVFSSHAVFYKKINKIFIKSKMYKDLQQLNREINVQYSPAVLSYLMDNKIEIKKDITATLLNLYERKVIDIEKNENKYIFKKGKKTESLGKDEQYIYQCFTENNYLNVDRWIELIKEEYFKYGFHEERESLKKKFDKIFYITSIIMASIIRYGLKETSFEFLILGCVAFVLCGNFMIGHFIYELSVKKYCINKNMLLSNMGKKEIKKWLKFEKFINEYTAIEERTIEETILFGKYIPYAMALNINKEYKNKELEIIDEKIRNYFEESKIY